MEMASDVGLGHPKDGQELRHFCLQEMQRLEGICFGGSSINPLGVSKGQGLLVKAAICIDSETIAA